MKSIMHLFEELVKDIAGSNAIKVLKLLEGKENVSEFKLAEDMDININELRIILYKLSEHNLINSIRRKDKQKGWYVYYWAFNFKHARDLLIKIKEKQIEHLKHKLTNQEIPKYVCPNNCISLNLEEAMEIEFKCPECSSLLKLKEIKYNAEIINKKTKEIEEDLEKLRQAIIVEALQAEKKVEKRKPKKIIKKIIKKKIKKRQKKKIIKKPVKKKLKPKKTKKKVTKKQIKKPKKIKKKQKKTGIIGKLKKLKRLWF